MLDLKENTRVRVLIACCLLSALIYSAFNNILDNDFFSVDDGLYVTQNPLVKEGLTWAAVRAAFASAEQGNWHPLTWISHMTDVSLYGMNPKGHHATNLAFHLFNGLLCFFLFYRITKSVSQAFLMGLFFAVHPLRVESVAWVSERKDVLSAFFAFLSLICYLEYGQKKSITAYLLCFACLLLSLMSKAMFVTLPFIFLLLDFWPLNRLKANPHSLRRSPGQILPLIIEKIPFFCTIVLGCLIAYRSQVGGGATFMADYYPFHLRCENAALSYIRYMCKILFPMNLAVFYPLTFSSLTLWQSLGAALLLVVVTGIFLKVRKSMPCLLVGWFWYLGTLVPVIGLVQIGPQAMADRYTYFPCIGILLILVTAGAQVAVAARQRTAKYGLIALAGTAAAFLFLYTSIQTTYWKDGMTLFRHTLEVTKQNPLIRLLYGEELEKAGEYEEAFEQYLLVHKQAPDQVIPLVDLSRVCLKQKKIPDAVQYARQACEVSNDRDPAVLKNLGFVLHKAGRSEESLDRLRQALRITNRHTQASLYLELEALYNQLLNEISVPENNTIKSPDETEDTLCK